MTEAQGRLAFRSPDTGPASFFGPDGGVVAGPAAVRGTYRFGAQLWLASDGSTVEMPLRIIEIFRRENSAWKLVHRYADPLQQRQ